MKRTCMVFSVLLIGIICACVLKAQGEKYEFAGLDGVWVSIKTGDQAFSYIKMPEADQRIAVQKRESIFEILKNTRVFTPFKGVALRAEKEVVGRADAQGKPNTGPVEMKVGLTIGYFRRSATGRIEPFTIEMPRIEIFTNNIQMAASTWDANKFWYEELNDEQGRAFFLEPFAVARAEGGLSIYRLDSRTEEVVVTNGRPLWIPAASEQFLLAMMTKVRKQRAKEIEDSRGSIPEEESLFVRFLRGYEKELAALSPAERQQPAYYARSNENPMHSGLVRANAPQARLVEIINPDYFDRSLPRTAIQLIACYYHYNVPFSSEEPENSKTSITLRMLNSLTRGLEYEKLAALIEM